MPPIREAPAGPSPRSCGARETFLYDEALTRRPLRLMVRTSGFQPENRSSILLGGTNTIKDLALGHPECPISVPYQNALRSQKKAREPPEAPGAMARVPKVRSPLQALLESWDNAWKSCSRCQTAKRGKAISPSTWNIVGLVCVMVGVLLLFGYGMPYRIRRGGASFLILDDMTKPT